MTEQEKAVREQREFYETGITREVSYRRAALGILADGIRRREGELLAALQEDLGKPACESYMTEIGLVLSEIRFLRRHLGGWSRPRRVWGALSQLPGCGTVAPEPYGTALVLSPWNYPIQLSLIPLAEAMAAGNCVTLKPSEQAPACCKALRSLLEELFEPCYVRVAEGDAGESEALTRAGFDTIFFTGSPAVGRRVMAAAAGTLTPVTLELGGKSPCIVTKDADLSLAARRIVWGKLLCSGQTCVAPDYILADREIKGPLVRELIRWTREFEGEDPLANRDLTRIVSLRHFDRLMELARGQKPLLAGRADRDSLRMSLTILDEPAESSPVMEEEIFGPVLPVVSFETLEEAARRVERGPHPLAVYVFTKDLKRAKKLMGRLTFGGGCVNDTVLHLASHRMPFGGVGASGMGSCHGEAGFWAFCRAKSVLWQRRRPDIGLRYRPYTPKKLDVLRKLMH
ncbi:MAG: aldehyde dehydrogenase family protein [Oscillospiraceae bacterium]|nr:aldehyde dehydrogenase family protein [Oscillospiraceae bacterium]